MKMNKFNWTLRYLTEHIAKNSAPESITPAFMADDFLIYNEDNIKVMHHFPDNCIDMIFADPPYMLSNNGLTCQNGQLVNINKGTWDKSKGFEKDLRFHEAWIEECKRILKPEGTIWISGTYHSIYQCGFLLQKMNFHLLNEISWFKPNASPNLSCRRFTASHETVLWAKKEKYTSHYFDYQTMKNGKFIEDNIKKEYRQMRSVWSIPTSPLSEKRLGKHPTQKPLALLKRIVLASTKANDIIFDPFNGSGTTGIACKIIGKRKYIGCDFNREYTDLTTLRYKAISAQ